MSGRSKVEVRAHVRVFIFLLVNIIIGLVLYNYLSFDKISQLSDFHVNIITASSIIGGFLFTGLGILLGAIGSHGVQRLFSHHYFDNFYITTMIGIFADVVSIIVSLMFMCTNLADKNVNLFYTIEISTFLCGLLAFFIAVINIWFIINVLKKPQ